MSDRAQPVHLDEILDASHENKWVAIAADYHRVLAAADSLPQLMQQMAGQDVIFHRVLPRDVSFAPIAFR
jgi:hypothetical protein